jgi:uncharacterized membrane protein (UPF0127 family)
VKAGTIERDAAPAIALAWNADRWWTRLRGLLGRAPLPADGSQALLIQPCASVHTFWMRYPLDIVFLDRAQRVLGWRENVRPWRAAAQPGARTTVEFHAGALAILQPRLGERWTWRPLPSPPAGGRG